MKNKYTVQIIGVLTAKERNELYDSVISKISNLENFTVKVVNSDLWCDPNGTVRTWDDDGKEITYELKEQTQEPQTKDFEQVEPTEQ